ncbi:MAG: galactokinase [Bilifractor sp.]|jgi:galactokinase
MTDQKVIEELRKTFEEKFGGEGERVFFAPGRVNLIGEHIDYNGGHVFPCALTLGTYAAVRKREDRKLRFYSVNLAEDGVIEADLDDLTYKKEDGWTNYAKGVVWAYRQAGMDIPAGFDFACSGTIPPKSGLSSSASLEVLTGEALMKLYGFEEDQVRNAKLGQIAENQFVGMNCGIMDQFASAMGQKDKAIFLNTATLDFQYAPVPIGEAKLVIVNTNKPHELANSAYNDRRRECETALEDLQKVRPELKALCELKPEEFELLSDAIADPVCRKRAKHAVYEDARTTEAVEKLNQGDIAAFGKLMNASHVSLRDDFEVSCRELDVLAEEAWKIPGVIGARMTGGGFGGCTVNIVEDNSVDTFVDQVGKNYTEKTGLVPSFYIVSIGDGPSEVG